MQIALEKLPVEERIAIVEQIWDSITQDYEHQKSTLSLAEKQLIDERLVELEQKGFVGKDYKTVLANAREHLLQGV